MGNICNTENKITSRDCINHINKLHSYIYSLELAMNGKIIVSSKKKRDFFFYIYITNNYKIKCYVPYHKIKTENVLQYKIELLVQNNNDKIYEWDTQDFIVAGGIIEECYHEIINTV